MKDAIYPATDYDLSGDVGPTVHSKWRVVIHCLDEETARRHAEKISKNIACDLECFIGVTNRARTKLHGEAVVHRELYGILTDEPEGGGKNG